MSFISFVNIFYKYTIIFVKYTKLNNSFLVEIAKYSLSNFYENVAGAFTLDNNIRSFEFCKNARVTNARVQGYIQEYQN